MFGTVGCDELVVRDFFCRLMVVDFVRLKMFGSVDLCD